jgi:hypothetical protein
VVWDRAGVITEYWCVPGGWLWCGGGFWRRSRKVFVRVADDCGVSESFYRRRIKIFRETKTLRGTDAKFP